MRTPGEVYQEWFRRRNGILRALTTDVNKLHELCDPDQENLCLYGFADGSWGVDIPEDDVPPEIPEPALGINYARDSMKKKDWLTLVAAHSDSWLMAVAFFKGACFDKHERESLFAMMNDLPSLFELVQNGLDYDVVGLQSPLWARKVEPHHTPLEKVKVSSGYHQFDSVSGETSGGDWKDGDGEPCPKCGGNYKEGEFWIACDFCDRWFCGRCAKMTQAKAEQMSYWKCTKCSCLQERSRYTRVG